MSKQEDEARLSRIDTLWSQLRQAHPAPGEGDSAADQQVRAAQEMLLQRYSRAIYRYLLGALGDPNAAEEVLQEFALDFLRGHFKKADPARGRFRDYIKTALSHLLARYHKRQRRQPAQAAEEALAAVTAPDEFSAEADEEFCRSWREELLTRTWESLAEWEKRTGSPFHTVLCWRTQHPEQDSLAMAEQLSQQLERPLTPENIRQTLHRARKRFAELLVQEVRQSLPGDDQNVEEELSALGLLPYCSEALRTGK